MSRLTGAEARSQLSGRDPIMRSLAGLLLAAMVLILTACEAELERQRGMNSLNQIATRACIDKGGMPQFDLGHNFKGCQFAGEGKND